MQSGGIFIDSRRGSTVDLCGVGLFLFFDGAESISRLLLWRDYAALCLFEFFMFYIKFRKKVAVKAEYYLWKNYLLVFVSSLYIVRFLNFPVFLKK